VSDKLHYVHEVGEINHLCKITDALGGELEKQPLNESLELDEVFVPVLKRAMLMRRRDEATWVENAKEMTHHPEILRKYDERLEPLDELLKQSWLHGMESAKMPRLLDFLSIQEVESHPTAAFNQLAERKYDEKFHILQAPELLLDDLRYYRRVCDARGVAVNVAYIDIDNFKQKFNSKYNEVQVDRLVLPRFMQSLEAHTFEHGFAYRFGGDEYVLLLPNMTFELAAHFLDDLRRRVAAVQYLDIAERTTISVGFCHLEADSYLTNCEAIERANSAKSFAKASGKDRVAAYQKGNAQDGELFIVRA
jgi:diguanylate cyclase (GGDEF)-like protein